MNFQWTFHCQFGLILHDTIFFTFSFYHQHSSISVKQKTYYFEVILLYLGCNNIKVKLFVYVSVWSVIARASLGQGPNILYYLRVPRCSGVPGTQKMYPKCLLFWIELDLIFQSLLYPLLAGLTQKPSRKFVSLIPSWSI